MEQPRFAWVPFMREMLAPAPFTPLPDFPPPAIAPLRGPIGAATVGVITLAGLQRRDEPLLGEANDLSYRILERDVPAEALTIAHKSVVRVFAEQDLNVVWPRDRLVELERDGTLGRFAPRSISMVGSITRYAALVEETVPRIHAELAAQDVDLVLLVPL